MATKIMEYTLSRSEKKRRSRNLEQLAAELAELSTQEIGNLPCERFLKDEITAVRDLKAGARKRQLKFLSKNLRQLEDTGPLYDFLAERKGSALQRKKEFHELENLRDAIINDALAAAGELTDPDEELAPDWPSPALEEAGRLFADLDLEAVREAARRYTRNRNAAQSREIFRALKAAAERQRWDR
jgi:ribosome-associated protein